MRRLSLFLLAVLGSLTLVGATSPATTASPDSLFAAKRYSEASQAYEALLQQSAPTVSALANLGNSYYQEGQLGRAVLSYERALLLDPRNAEAQEVSAFLQRKTVDRLPSPESWLRQAGDRLAYAAPLTLWLVLCPLALGLSLAGWVVFALSREPRTRRLSFYGALVALAPALLSLALILHWTSAPRYAEARAVLLLPERALYSDPSASSQEVMKLHEGTRVLLTGKEQNGWRQVQLPDGRQGWLEGHTLEAVAPLPYPKP